MINCFIANNFLTKPRLVQKTTFRIKSIAISLMLVFMLTTHLGFAQNTTAKNTAATELKHFWKKNEILAGVGSALVFTLIVYAFWRKKKRSLGNIDSTL